MNNITYENCEIRSVWSRCYFENMHFGDYLIKINVITEDRCFPTHTEIQIDCRDFKKRLLDIVNDKVKIGYFSHGMEDINIFKNKDERYIIEWSPGDSSYISFVFDSNDFIKNLVEAVS